jgi:D-alanyl-D-alanine carboxypeptidase/D-alanyl-D-alanine-endopeptidase (penicillin-binding protein 4)
MTILKNKFLLMVLSTVLLTGCSVSKKIQKELEEQAANNNYFTGVVVYNTKTKKKIIDFQGSKYFTPASNTKLFTFYTAWKTLKDSVVSFEYANVKDSLIIRGAGDPGFLEDTINTNSLDFLRSANANIYLIDEKIEDSPYGDGWSWDDFPYYYMPEKSIFPVYGNTVKLNKTGDSLNVIPSFFLNKVKMVDQFQTLRAPEENLFYVKKTDVHIDKSVPFKTSNQLVADLLGQELGAKVTLIPNKESYLFQPYKRVPYDTLFTKMLVVSDNFIAEQLMLQVSKKTVGKFSVTEGIQYALDNYLKEIPQKPRWVDGSGLSRYNLFTPASMVYVLQKMYEEIPRDKLFGYFPEGGKTGTLKNNYEGQPYIRAKSGSLSNNYSLSGYLITKKGTLLIFSYMNNHFQGASAARKKEMKVYFSRLYDTY